MGHSTKFANLHQADAPTGYRLPHAATAPAISSSPSSMNSKNHKHFHSHSHSHVDTPYPVLEHSSSMSTVSSDGSTGSTDYMQAHGHHHLPSFHNPMHAVHEHVAELRYGHTTRAAKREAKKSTSHPWSLDAALVKPIAGAIEEKYEEVVEDWKDRDQQAWAEELRKRERARTSLSISPDPKVEPVNP